ncbi:MAG: 3-phosphoserine/phosphohydroxythreonine transaminase [Myxococcales bacterium]|nr:3-phosphoserine/phosphohydroxythreonine transaminase [Myxococcales bacterium]
MTRTWNFSAGPAVLPEAVLRRAQAALWDLDDSGIGVLEHSHRGPEFMAVQARAERLVRELAAVPDDHDVLFMQGGASTQFFMVPMNLLDGGTADYCDTGVWSAKAIAEARRFGEVHVACSSEASQHTTIPGADATAWSASPRYAHYTSNNTIYGTQWAAPPAPPADVPLVCDASSDIFSRPIDVARHGLIYAGAQKNLGPSGVTLVIVAKALVARGRRDLPTMLQYRTFADHGSMFNTPPTFGIYVLAEVLTWIKTLGGLAAMAERNRAKAAILYDELDRSPLFRGVVHADARSHMNVTFRSPTPALDAAFIAAATARGLSGLAGHRSVGGMRASLYNAMEADGVRALVAFMREFAADHPR